MDSSLRPTYELIRPQRRTAVAWSIAGLEFVLLVTIAGLAFGHPLVHAIEGARQATTVPQVRHRQAIVRPVQRPRIAVARAVLRPPDELRVVVLNGNGLSGAAGKAAAALRRRGYRIALVANAARQNYALSLVMYRPGYRADGLRLAHDFGIRVVGPLDGIRARTLHGGELAVILGR